MGPVEDNHGRLPPAHRLATADEARDRTFVQCADRSLRLFVCRVGGAGGMQPHHSRRKAHQESSRLSNHIPFFVLNNRFSNEDLSRRDRQQLAGSFRSMNPRDSDDISYVKLLKSSRIRPSISFLGLVYLPLSRRQLFNRFGSPGSPGLFLTIRPH